MWHSIQHQVHNNNEQDNYQQLEAIHGHKLTRLTRIADSETTCASARQIDGATKKTEDTNTEGETGEQILQKHRETQAKGKQPRLTIYVKTCDMRLQNKLLYVPCVHGVSLSFCSGLTQASYAIGGPFLLHGALRVDKLWVVDSVILAIILRLW